MSSIREKKKPLKYVPYQEIEAVPLYVNQKILFTMFVMKNIIILTSFVELDIGPIII